MLLIAVVIKLGASFGDAKSQSSVRTVYRAQLKRCAHPQSIIGQARDSRIGRVITHLAQQILKSQKEETKIKDEGMEKRKSSTG